jgi:peptide/nickel transport system permease protein
MSDTHQEYASYWSIVWEQYRKNKIAFGGLSAIGMLFALAIFAPVFASKLPYVWMDAEGISFPWLKGLLFNRNAFNSAIDIFFNLLLVLSPVFAGLYFIGKRKLSAIPARQRSAAAWRAIGFVALGTLGLFVILLAIEPRTALLQYRELIGTDPDAWGIFPPLRIQYDDTLNGVDVPGLFSVLGRDNAGRDVFVRLLYGTRVSLSVGAIAVSIYISIGTTLGAMAGYFGGIVDISVQRALEIFLCFPSFFMILTFIGFLEQPSIIWVMVIIGLLGWTGPARLVRGEFLRLRNIDFVAAARACGLSNGRIIFRHILPNAIGPVLVNATFGVASAVLVEFSLSFLGFGDPTMPSWGRILAYGRSTGDTRMMLIAGGAIFVTVSVFNLAGEGFRDALDPKLRR